MILPRRHPRALHRRRGRRPPRSISSTTLLILILLGSFLLLAWIPSLPVCAEEIEATDEWTELGPNDTIPAGLHVKIDMSTGRKFVKKMEEGEMTDFDKQRLGVPVDVEVDAVGSASVVTGREAEEGGAGAAAAAAAASKGVAVSASDSSDVTDVTETEDKGAGGKEDGYDYEMMHRTLSNLPPDEMAKYGGLPELPAGLGTPKVSPEVREHFESKMREIWAQRQALLKEVQEKHVADVAEVIMGRVRVIAEYMDDPVGKRAEIESGEKGGEGGGAGTGLGDGEESPSVVNNVVESLEDLEYQLSDVDLARDFHTLGGWSLTVSLLSDSVHCPSPSAHTVGQEDADPANETIAAMEAARRECLEELASSSGSSSSARAMVDKIQSLAAWTMGTAVKNHEEFHGWALEDLSGLISHSSSPEDDSAAAAAAAEDGPMKEPVTAVSLLLSDYLSEDAAASLSAARKSRRQKGLYALGALVRGNVAAQSHFVELDGPAALAEALSKSLDAGDARFASRVLALGYDLLTDAGLLAETGREGEGAAATAREQPSGMMVEALTTKPWCDAAVRLSSPGGGVSIQVREKALEALATLARRCGYGEQEKAAVVRSRAEWLGGGSGEDDDDYLDPSYRNDLVALADAALSAIDGSGGGGSGGEKAAKER